LIGDGSFRNRICLTTPDVEILSLLKLPGNTYIKKATTANSGLAWDYLFQIVDRGDTSVPSIRKLIADLGLYNKLSKEKFVPKQYKLASVEDRINLLRGLFDTDGSWSGGFCVEYATTSKQLAEDVHWMVSSIGGKCVTTQRKTRYSKKDGTKSDWFDSFRLTVKFPAKVNPCRLSRKASMYENIKRQVEPARALESIEAIGSGYATCISVDSPDHLFLTRNCVPTHNTSSALRIAAGLGKKTLVIVNKGFFMRQWQKRISFFFPDAKIGFVQQSKCDYKDKDIVIAMVHSLAQREYEPELYSAFGLVIVDEAHRISAHSFYQVIPKFAAKYRLGLTATPRRKDRTEQVFFQHIGPIVYTASSEAMVPKIIRRKTSFKPKAVHFAGKSISVNELKSATLLNQVAADKARSKELADIIVQAIPKGRKVFVVSERLEQLWDISQMLRNTAKARGFKLSFDFATGDQYCVDENGDRIKVKKKKKGKTVTAWKTRKTTDEDLDRGESAQVLFATKQMIEEGFDIEALDVLILATPMGDVEQTAGRVRRWCDPEPSKCKRLCSWRAGICQGKPTPIIIDSVDEGSEKLAKKWNYRQEFYKSIGAIE
jgi:hypothetical protein